MKILVLTPIYPAATNPRGATPVVHYFTKEWVKMNHEVHVCHLCAKYPSIFYWFSRCFHHFISDKTGMIAPIYPPKERTECLDDVKIYRIALKKVLPHKRFRETVIRSTISKIVDYYGQDNKPDVIVGHWINPQLEVLVELKKIYKSPICLVLHEKGQDIIKLYKSDANAMISAIDLIGFRCMPLKQSFEKVFGSIESNFMAYSGIPDAFIEQNIIHSPRTFQCIENYIFIGSLIKRKHPAEILSALSVVYGESNFSMKYIGEGLEKKVIESECRRLKIMPNVTLLGRIERTEILNHLRESDVFIMISENEVFGLVYLEAMALGCIPIASKGEGFDGIIVDGVNGFLCKAGDSQELASIIKKIRYLSPSELNKMSTNAIHTAQRFTDKIVAQNYLDSLSDLVE